MVKETEKLNTVMKNRNANRKRQILTDTLPKQK